MDKNVLAINFTALERITTPEIGGINLGQLVGKFVPYLLSLAGIVLLLMLISAGIQFFTSGGDPKKTQVAQSKLTSALLGFFIVVFAYLIVRFFGVAFNVSGILNVFR